METERHLIDFESSIGPWLGKTVKIVDYHLQEAFKKANLDLTKEQMVVLKKLNEEDGLNQNELAFLTYRDKSSLARLLSKMEQKDYVIRQKDENDKRVNKVFLTNTGKDIYQKARPEIQQVILKMERKITDTERKQMISVLKKVQGNFMND
ncbi:MAG: MarR family winged helix-turn-helix transcriptional regulator [Maribacter sp.]